MLFERRLFKLITLLAIVSLFLVACERPLQRDTRVVEEPSPTPAEVAPPVTEITPEDPPPTPDTTEPPATTTEETPVAPPAEEVQPPAETEPTDDPEVGGGVPGMEESPPPVAQEVPAEEAQPAAPETAAPDPAIADPAAAAAGPVTHVVAPGENLFRIGLRYGVSWVVIAQHNNIPNPHRILVGQVLTIPMPGAPPSVPSPGTTYTVRPGDNLFRIGLRFGVSWIQIAEANGIVNPNQIFAGQVLKIPTSAPGGAPQFTHVVRGGETLFQISLRYGVAWTTIAAVNNLAPPYAIFPGQTLVIPGR